MVEPILIKHNYLRTLWGHPVPLLLKGSPTIYVHLNIVKTIIILTMKLLRLTNNTIEAVIPKIRSIWFPILYR